MAGPKRVYANKWAIEEYFALPNAQMDLGMRLRVSTIRLRAEEDVETDHCLLSNPEIPDIQVFLSQLAQPTWKEHEATSKIVIDKLGTGVHSPDIYDACSLTFARDSLHGLAAR